MFLGEDTFDDTSSLKALLNDDDSPSILPKMPRINLINFDYDVPF